VRRAAAVALLVATFLPAPASAWCRMTTSRRAPSVEEPCVLPDESADPPEQFLEWRRPCHGVAVSMEALPRDFGEEELRAILLRSFATWNDVRCDGQPLGIEVQLLGDSSTCTAPFYEDGSGNANTVMFTFDWAERMYDANAFAVTTVWHRRSTGEILDADMEINERRGPYGTCPDEGCSTRLVDLENVVTHEMGHFLGLAHSTDREATMFASSVAGEVIKRDLSPDDVEGICTVYPAGRPEGECSFVPANGLDLDCEPSCGCRVPSPSPTPAWPLGLVGLILARALGARRRS